MSEPLVSRLTPQRLMLASVGVALLTIALKGLAWWLTGSVGLLSDALESFVNLGGAMFALAMVTVARRPPDADHPFGHHKAEYFSSGFEGLLIIVAAAAIFWAAGQRLLSPQPLQRLDWGLALSVLSSVFNGVLAWLLLRVGRERRSIALEANGRHLVTDVWTSVGVIAGVAAVWATGWLWLDPVVAIAVALNILREGYSLVHRSSQGLMDQALEPGVLADIERTLQRFHEPGVRFDHLATRTAGQARFIDLHMHVPGHWTLRRAAELRNAVERELLLAVPGLRATIQLLPTDVEAHAPVTEARDDEAQAG
ncbi:cation diffusion facilitator family transporter [Ramlibacter rhizophilus]|uniref:Cation transporter n=1 Tax=Ramlibacter rhizophilus TaxID=1781167 RepID=A0A4Z0BL77_9BURK|nr:cation diffusion facilitator family transporter [Ramlibacter rhizophilus]TFY99540.1 cation transporter [Ramlibacter rhizophilus]